MDVTHMLCSVIAIQFAIYGDQTHIAPVIIFQD